MGTYEHFFYFYLSGMFLESVKDIVCILRGHWEEWSHYNNFNWLHWYLFELYWESREPINERFLLFCLKWCLIDLFHFRFTFTRFSPEIVQIQLNWTIPSRLSIATDRNEIKCTWFNHLIISAPFTFIFIDPKIRKSPFMPIHVALQLIY